MLTEEIGITSEVIAILSEVISLNSENFGRKGYFFRNLSFDKKEILTYFYKRKYNSNELLISSPRAYVHTREENFSFLGFADFLRCRREKKKKLREKEKEPCRNSDMTHNVKNAADLRHTLKKAKPVCRR